MAAQKQDKVIIIQRIPHKVLRIPVVGTAELIMNQVPKWVKDDIMAKNRGETVVPVMHSEDEQYEASIYRNEKGEICMPGAAFKSALVEGGLRYYDLKMTDSRVHFHVPPEWIPIIGTPHRREDMIRTQQGSLQVSIRAGFPEWSAIIPIRYPTHMFSENMIYNLLEVAGLIGVGAHRPASDRSNTGIFGTFTIMADAWEKLDTVQPAEVAA